MESILNSKYVIEWCPLEVRKLWSDLPVCLTAADLRWEYPKGEITLASGEIHLWRVRLDQPAPCLTRCNSLLSKDERARASRFHFEKDRKRFIVRRGLLRLILGNYTRVEPTRLRFTCGAFGKPALSFPSGVILHFNLSHSDGLALFAMTSMGPVGIDVERQRPIAEADKIVSRYFPPREIAEWLALPASERPEVFLRLWARLEASHKASGCGIAGSLARTATPPATRARGNPPDHPATHTTTQKMAIQDLIPAPNYVASIAFHW